MDQSISGSEDNLPVNLSDAFRAVSGKHEWAEQTIRQIEKDFRLQGLSLNLPANNPGLDKLVSLLSAEMQSAKLLDRSQLLGLLYQLDINESLIRKKIAEMESGKPYELLAMEIVKRCFTKVYLRNTLK
jgi:hypothetical protein